MLVNRNPDSKDVLALFKLFLVWWKCFKAWWLECVNVRAVDGRQDIHTWQYLSDWWWKLEIKTRNWKINTNNKLWLAISCIHSYMLLFDDSNSGPAKFLSGFTLSFQP